MGDDRKIEHRRILQDAQHHAGIVDPAPAGGDALCAGIAHQRDFGQFLSAQAARCSGQRMNPEAGLAGLGGEAHPRGMVQRRCLVGHQRGPGDAAEVEGGLVDREYTQIDEAGRDNGAACVDHAVARLRLDIADCRDQPVLAANRTQSRFAFACYYPAVDDRERHCDAHAQPSILRALRVSTSTCEATMTAE